MASVIAERHKGRVRYRVQFNNADGRRKSIRLTGVDKRTAKAIGVRVDELNACRIGGQAIRAPLAAWVASLGDELHGKLATAGLVEPRQTANLSSFLDQYISSRVDVSERSIKNWRVIANDVAAFYGYDRNLRSISPGDADDYRQYLAATYADATVGGHIKFVKHCFRYAYRKGVIDANPFEDVKGAVQHNDERHHYITRADTDELMRSLPDGEWRLILGLCRYGGLRCPSEVLQLQWSDIDWERRRIRVTSPKTKKKGKGTRAIPLFPELEPLLAECFESASEGSVYCISRYRDQSVNLRTSLLRYLKRAGLQPWPRLFQNFRSSRETELARSYPIHVVTAWLGNTPQVAQRHYLQITDADFDTAANGAGGGATGGAVSCSSDMKPPATAPPDAPQTSRNVVFPDVFGGNEYTPLDSNQ